MRTNIINFVKRKAVYILTIALFYNANILGQDQKIPDDIFFEIACFKAKKAGAADYFKTTGKAINTELKKQGIITNWKVFKVDFPNGSACECDFRAVRVFRGMDALEKLKDGAIREQAIKNVWPDKTSADISKEFRASLEFKYSQVFNMMDALIPEPTNSDMVVVNFMDVKSENRSTYVDMERNVFKPLHDKNHKAGRLIDWVLASRIIPYGASIETDYITMDKYAGYSNMQNTEFRAMFKEVHPDKNFEETMDKMGEMRTLSRAEIWRQISME